MGNMCLVYTKEEKKSVTVIWCISGTYILVEQKEKKKKNPLFWRGKKIKAKLRCAWQKAGEFLK